MKRSRNAACCSPGRRGSEDRGLRRAEIGAKSQGAASGELLAGAGLELALDALIPFAHWVTPPIMPKRFDTRFYIVAAPNDQIAIHDGAESVDSVWINPARALAEAKAGKYTLVFATALNVQMLGQSADVASALAAARARRIVTVEPVAERTERATRCEYRSRRVTARECSRFEVGPHGSRLALVEHENVDAAGREVLHVGDGGLPFRARKAC